MPYASPQNYKTYLLVRGGPTPSPAKGEAVPSTSRGANTMGRTRAGQGFLGSSSITWRPWEHTGPSAFAAAPR